MLFRQICFLPILSSVPEIHAHKYPHTKKSTAQRSGLYLSIYIQVVTTSASRRDGMIHELSMYIVTILTNFFAC